MATGGTIPTNRTQTVTFFNTTGIVDRDKNIYFAPRFSKYAQMSSGRDVRSAYLEIFKTVCPPSSAYADIQISGWSPQDRTLKVRGNIDDFRLVTEEGECLNYFILSRTITKEDVDKTYYYGFFITGVQQAGGGSVLLTVEPDDFTNVFYLHNQYRLTAGDIQNDYEPFNEKIKNAYVNRQHYNRVKYGDRYVSDSTQPVDVEVEGSSIGARAFIAYQLPQNAQIDLLSISFTGSVVNIPAGVTLSYRYFSSFFTVIFNNLEIGQTASIKDMVLHFNLIYHDVIELDNMKVFLNQEETFRFKYQYRDMKYPLPLYTDNFTSEEKNIIENEDNFDNLSLSLKKKIIKCCVSFLALELKSIEITSPYWYESTRPDGHGGYNDFHLKYINRIGELVGDKLKRPNMVLYIPFIEIPQVFKKYSFGDILSCRLSVVYPNVNPIKVNLPDDINRIQKILSNKSISDYVYSMYVVKDINFKESEVDVVFYNQYHTYIDFTVTTPNFNGGLPQATIDTWYDVNYEKSFYIGGILTKPIKEADLVKNDCIVISGYGDNPSSVSTIYDNVCAGIVSSGIINKDISISIHEELPDLVNNYYDNVLEAEPYSYYSLSYLSGYEISFNKNRYYSGIDSQIIIRHFISVNGAVKESYIPIYTIEGIESIYFNEGLVYTVASSMPLVSDSYTSYYYQNKAQMKNQYAVNNYQNGTDLLQRFFISSPNQVGLRASKAGGWGALAETGNQIMGMVDDAIDWAQSDKIIGMNQQAKLADMGAKPDVIKQVGSEVIYDLASKEDFVFLNHYTIDELSYNSIAKLFERTGYQVNLYTTLNTIDRVGWNFIKLNACDVVGNITLAQESTIRKIFTEGVTLLHDKSYLTSGHNFETILEGGE